MSSAGQTRTLADIQGDLDNVNALLERAGKRQRRLHMQAAASSSSAATPAAESSSSTPRPGPYKFNVGDSVTHTKTGKTGIVVAQFKMAPGALDGISDNDPRAMGKAGQRNSTAVTDDDPRATRNYYKVSAMFVDFTSKEKNLRLSQGDEHRTGSEAIAALQSPAASTPAPTPATAAEATPAVAVPAAPALEASDFYFKEGQLVQFRKDVSASEASQIWHIAERYRSENIFFYHIDDAKDLSMLVSVPKGIYYVPEDDLIEVEPVAMPLWWKDTPLWKRTVDWNGIDKPKFDARELMRIVKISNGMEGGGLSNDVGALYLGLRERLQEKEPDWRTMLEEGTLTIDRLWHFYVSWQDWKNWSPAAIQARLDALIASNSSSSSSAASPAAVAVTPAAATPAAATPAPAPALADPLNLALDEEKNMQLSPQQMKIIPYMFRLLSRERQEQLTGGSSWVRNVHDYLRDGNTVTAENVIKHSFIRVLTRSGRVTGGLVNARQMWHLADSLEVYSVEDDPSFNRRLLKGGTGGSPTGRGAGKINDSGKHNCTCTQGNLKYVFIVKARDEYKSQSPMYGRDLILLGSDCINFLSYDKLRGKVPVNYPSMRAGGRRKPYLEASFHIATILNDFKQAKEMEKINRARLQKGLYPMSFDTAARAILRLQPEYRDAPFFNENNELTLMRVSQSAVKAVLKYIRRAAVVTTSQLNYIKSMETERFKREFTNLRNFIVMEVPRVEARTKAKLTKGEASLIIEKMKLKGYNLDNGRRRQGATFYF